MPGGEQRSPEARFVVLLMRIMVVLAAILLALDLAAVIVEGGLGNAIFCALVAGGLGFMLALLRLALSGAHERAIERFFVVIFVACGASIAAVDGNGGLLALVVVLVILIAAPRVLPPARTDRWVYGALSFFVAVGVLEFIDPSYRLAIGAAEAERSTIFFGVAILVLGVVAAFHFRRYPLATKLAVGFMTAALVPFALDNVGSAKRAADRARAEITARVRFQADQAAARLDSHLARLHDAIRWLADDEGFGRAVAGREGADAAAIVDRWLARVIASEQRMRVAAFVVGGGGRLEVEVGGGRSAAGVGAAVAGREAGGAFEVIEVEGEPYVFLVEPIRGGARSLVVALHPDLLRGWASGAGEALDYAILDDDARAPKVLFAGPRSASRWQGPREGLVTAVAPLGAVAWAIGVAEDESAIEAARAAEEHRSDLTLVLLGALATALSLALGRRISRSLSEVGDVMGRFTGGEVGARATITVDDEIGVLARRFNHLAEEIGALLAAREEQAMALRAEVAEGQRKEARLQVLNAEHAAARDAALAANRAKSTFLAQMSHELRTPLNAIIGYTELIAEQATERGDAAVADDARRVIHAAHHLLGIITDILDLSKIEAGKHEVSVREVDVVALVDEVCETLQPMVLRKENQLVVTRKVQRLDARTDRTKLRQSLLNLLSNANKFTNHGVIEVVVDAIAVDGAPWMALTVCDEGIGIPSAKIGLLFEPFTQVDNSPTRRFDGTGLGLAITRRFCRMLGGDVTVESELGRGSSFTIRLPLRAPEG